MSLVSKNSILDAWNRHILDSAQLWPILEDNFIKNWVDIGSGAGFPGLVIAAIAAEKKPEIKITLIESDKRKCAFLREAAQVLSVSVNIISERVENTPCQQADVLSARAVCSFSKLLDYSKMHRVENGVSVFFKGKKEYEEITLNNNCKQLDLRFVPSTTNISSFVVCVGLHDGIK